MQNILLALSDQQLVTGIALLIAAFVRHSDITIYSTNIVMSLTLLSSTVHLATMPTLRPLWRQHLILKWIRAFTMYALFTMIMFLLFPPIGSNWWPTPRSSDLFFTCALRRFRTQKTPARICTQVGVAVYFFVSYVEAIGSLFTQNDRNWPAGQILLQLLCNKSTLNLLPDSKKVTSQRALHTPRFVPAAVWGLVCAESYAFFEYCESYAYNMNWLLFAQVYSVTYIIVSRNESQGTVGPFNRLGYGQIVAIVMLLLPLFAALEALYGSFPPRLVPEPSLTLAQTTEPKSRIDQL